MREVNGNINERTVPQRRAVGFSRGTPFFLVVFYGADFSCKRLLT